MGYRVPGSTEATITDNYIVGGNPAFSVVDFDSGVVTGNTVVAGKLAQARIGAVPFSNFVWNNNNYYDLSTPSNCNDPNNGQVVRLPFSANNGSDFLFTCGGGGQAGNLPFQGVTQGWRQATGWDANSNYRLGLPNGAEALVIRYQKSDYEIGRAHIQIFNWGGLNQVTVDLSQTGLVPNQFFEIKDAQNYFGPPVYSGFYDPAVVVTLPMTNTAVTAPIGDYWLRPGHTPKEFQTFVVVPQR